MPQNARGFIQAFVNNPNPYTQAVAQKQAALSRGAATRLQKQKGAQQLALLQQRQQGQRQLLGGRQYGQQALAAQNIAQRKQLASQYQQQRLQFSAAQNANRQAQARAQAQAQAQANLAGSVTDSFGGLADRVNGWAASIPTPGGIFVVLVAIFVTLWVLIPVNQQGYTRAELLWLTVLGRTAIKGSSQEQAKTSSSIFSGTEPVGLTSVGTIVPLQDFSAAGNTTM